MTVENIVNIDQNSRSQTNTESVLSVSKLSNESVGSRRELVANCVHTADRDPSSVCQFPNCRNLRTRINNNPGYLTTLSRGPMMIWRYAGP